MFNLGFLDSHSEMISGELKIPLVLRNHGRNVETTESRSTRRDRQANDEGVDATSSRETARVHNNRTAETGTIQFIILWIVVTLFEQMLGGIFNDDERLVEGVWQTNARESRPEYNVPSNREDDSEQKLFIQLTNERLITNKQQQQHLQQENPHCIWCKVNVYSNWRINWLYVSHLCCFSNFCPTVWMTWPCKIRSCQTFGVRTRSIENLLEWNCFLGLQYNRERWVARTYTLAGECSIFAESRKSLSNKDLYAVLNSFSEVETSRCARRKTL